jgi:hypothetical protein
MEIRLSDNLKSHLVNLYGKLNPRYVRRYKVIRVKKDIIHCPDGETVSTSETSVKTQ